MAIVVTNPDKPVHPETSIKLQAHMCKLSFWRFIKKFWSEVPGAGEMTYNWHMEFLANELQEIAERVFKGEKKEYDLVVNVPPGTSKSSICSILYPAWIWTRMPTARVLSASHTDSLVLDLANKSREVIRSEKYRQFFPEIELSSSQDAKEYFTNTCGGDRKTCTVGGKTPMGFHGHFIICLPWESRILTSLGSLPIGYVVDNKLPVKVLGYDHDKETPVWKNIFRYESSPGRPLCRVSFDNGSKLELTDNHPVYVVGRGYIPADELSIGDEVINVDSMHALREGEVSTAKGSKKVEVGMDLLQSQVQSNLHECGEPSSLLRREASLQGMRQGDDCRRVESENSEGLLQEVLVNSLQEGRSSEEAKKTENFLCDVREEYYDYETRSGKKKMLFSRVCKRDALATYERDGESEFRSRYGILSLFPGFQRESEKDGEAEGEVSLFQLQPSSEQEWQGSGSTSHRLEQAEQCDGESGGYVQGLSHEFTGRQGEGCKTGKNVVVSIERGIRIPSKVYNVAVSETHNYFAEGILVHNCDDPLDPQSVLSEAELSVAKRFMTHVLPTRRVNKEVSVTMLIMQRLGLGDPTGVLLEEAKKDGAASLRHICLPSELQAGGNGTYLPSNVKPVELFEKYTDGLLDPKRMSRYSLGEFKARGSLFYSTQFLQEPYSPEGGMFKVWYFNKRVAAAPYNCKRIRFWDRASTEDGGCYTAGVLLARDKEGLFYIEHVVHGQWEPVERNHIMRATALRDRTKYGRYEPTIYIEAEGGSSGKDAWLGILKALAGFDVREAKVSGKKDTRAEPWSAQLAGGAVFLVEDNTWDINNYISEHLQFKPDVTAKRLGRYKDQVDASSGAFNTLANVPQIQGISVYKLGKPMKGQHRFILCNKQELEDLIIEDQRCLLVCVDDPYPVGSDLIPTHGLHNLLGVLSLQFAYINPRDYQDKWEQSIEPYGKKCEELVISQDQGKKLFAFILKKRDPCPTVFVICDDNKERRETVGLAICDVLNFQRNKLLWQPGSTDIDYGTMKPENEHLFTVVKNSRSLVVV